MRLWRWVSLRSTHPTGLVGTYRSQSTEFLMACGLGKQRCTCATLFVDAGDPLGNA